MIQIFMQNAPYLLGGMLLAAVYLALLALTVKYLQNIKHKALFLLSSALIRIALVIGLTCYFAYPYAIRVFFILLGFIIVRYGILFFVSKKGATK